MLYELLTGSRVGPNRVPLASQALEFIVTKCLKVDPDERWQSAEEVRQQLLNCRADTIPGMVAKPDGRPRALFHFPSATTATLWIVAGLVIGAGAAYWAFAQWLSFIRPSADFRLQAHGGWQNSGFRLSTHGRPVTITATGRISLGLEEEEEKLVPLLLPKLSPSLQYTLRGQFFRGAPSLTRSWISAYGDADRRDERDELRMVPDLIWGVVLCAVIEDPPPDIELRDPWSIGIRSTDIVPVQLHRSLLFGKSGVLVCIVNDRVLSPNSPNFRASEIYNELRRSSSWRVDRAFSPENLPFLFLNNNIGEFTLRIKPE